MSNNISYVSSNVSTSNSSRRIKKSLDKNNLEFKINIPKVEKNIKDIYDFEIHKSM